MILTAITQNKDTYSYTDVKKVRYIKENKELKIDTEYSTVSISNIWVYAIFSDTGSEILKNTEPEEQT